MSSVLGSNSEHATGSTDRHLITDEEHSLLGSYSDDDLPTRQIAPSVYSSQDLWTEATELFENWLWSESSVTPHVQASTSEPGVVPTDTLISGFSSSSDPVVLDFLCSNSAILSTVVPRTLSRADYMSALNERNQTQVHLS